MVHSTEHALGLCNRWHVPDYSEVFRPRLMLTFMDPGARPPRLGTHQPDHWEVIEVHDINERPLIDDRRRVIPARKHIERILDLADRWDGEGRVLVTCDAGVSRSSAGLLILAAAFSSHGIRRACQEFRRQAPWVEPNHLMIEIADDVLGLDGHLIEATHAMGMPDFEARTTPVCFVPHKPPLDKKGN